MSSSLCHWPDGRNRQAFGKEMTRSDGQHRTEKQHVEGASRGRHIALPLHTRRTRRSNSGRGVRGPCSGAPPWRLEQTARRHGASCKQHLCTRLGVAARAQGHQRDRRRRPCWCFVNSSHGPGAVLQAQPSHRTSARCSSWRPVMTARSMRRCWSCPKAATRAALSVAAETAASRR